MVTTTDGTVAALEPRTGIQAWALHVPVPDGLEPMLLATPVQVKNKLVIAYQLHTLDTKERQSHRVAVIDLDKQAFDDAYPEVELTAEKPTGDGLGVVKFDPPYALSRAALVHGRTAGAQMGYVYVSLANYMDMQPWHGWVFEINLDAWAAKGAAGAISAVLLTTPESDCGEADAPGSRSSLCGGGVWSHAGPQVYPVGDSFELLVPTGNGQLNINRKDYANTLMRLRPGLSFEPGCDEKLCANFDPLAPATACVESCTNLFIPRLLSGDAPLRPASGACEGKTFWECVAWMDYDLGSSSPVKVVLPDGPALYVQPSKDGHVYLIDANHMGILYDRERLVETCGAPGDECRQDWAGMIMTQPALTFVHETPVVIVPTFLPDKTHPAGLVALKIIMKGGKPRFERFWTAPNFSTEEAVQRFRSRSSRVALAPFGKNGELYGWVFEAYTILGVRIRDGAIVERALMAGWGRRFILPLIYDDVLYVPSCLGEWGLSRLEAYAIVRREE
ncbi:MAG: hypothetical protein AB7P69_19970 [Candidatus Binatia bacterium]